jgi:AcrR family transcriptional regulator
MAQPAAGDDERCSLWERLERPSVPRATLTHAQIAEAAVAIADADGLDAVTMRGLAARLGAAPMALYRYVHGKDDLFELMVDAVAPAAPPADLPADPNWRTALRAHAFAMRSVTLRHGWLVDVPPKAQTALTPRRFEAMEHTLAVLSRLDLDADHVLAVLDTVTNYAMGAAGSEMRMRRLMESSGWATGDEMRSAMAPRMRWLLSTGRYPTFQRLLRESGRKDDPTWRFELGLECVLDGLAARLGI